MTAGRRLVDALVAVASRYEPAARKEKLRLLGALAGRRLGRPRALLRLHETLCFLQAYPDDPEVLEHVDRALAEFPRRVARLRAAARGRLHDSGIVNTTLDYPFGLPMARWLSTPFPRDCEVAWARFVDTERLDETLSLLAAAAEGDAFSEGGMGWRAWLRVAKGGRRMSDLQLLLEVFERTGLPEETRDWLYESLALPVMWRLRSVGASRTLARVPPARVFFHADGLERRAASLVDALARPLPSLRRAPRALAEALLEAARVAMATRQRELHAFSHPNLDDVLLVDAERGVRLVFVGILPGFRLPLEGYYAFLALKNGIPVAYGGGWELFGTLDFAVNVFAAFRQGESAFVATELLRAYRRIFGMRTVVVDRYQLGHESAEALRSGSFYFYHRLGFRPRDPVVLGVLAAEQSKITADRSYRSPIPVLARLALGVSGWTAWPAAERCAFARLSLVAALITDLERWPSAERRRLVRVFRAKGCGSERAYANLLDSHRRFRRSLEALVT